MNKFIILSLAFFWAVSCESVSAQNNTMSALHANTFSLPDIPSELIQPQERASYLVAHYWDNYNFSDISASTAHTELTEQIFVDFIDLLPYVAYDEAAGALTHLMESAAINEQMLACFAGLSEKYLYEISSPFHNDEYYIPVLQYMVSSSSVSEADKLRPSYQLEMALKNRLGSTANDFAYTLKNDSRGTLHTIVADYTLLFFNNPDCAECIKVKNAIFVSEIIAKLLNENSSRVNGKKLAVLSIYTEADIPLWLQSAYPDTWLNAYDAEQSVTNKQLYDLRTLPTLYLLDSDKRVIFKEVSIEAVEAWLNSNA